MSATEWLDFSSSLCATHSYCGASYLRVSHVYWANMPSMIPYLRADSLYCSSLTSVVADPICIEKALEYDLCFPRPYMWRLSRSDGSIWLLLSIHSRLTAPWVCHLLRFDIPHKKPFQYVDWPRQNQFSRVNVSWYVSSTGFVGLACVEHAFSWRSPQRIHADLDYPSTSSCLAGWNDWFVYWLINSIYWQHKRFLAFREGNGTL